MLDERTLVLGAHGMVGRAICRELSRRGISYIDARVDLRERHECRELFYSIRPTSVVLAAAKVGGILANRDFPVDFLLDNLEIAANVLRCSHEVGVEKLLNLGSSCIYPRSELPIRESDLLCGPLEPTNRAYAVAKIAVIEMCDAYRRQHGRDYISVMPCNLYGEHDNFDLQGSHVLPAMIRKLVVACETGAATVELWGDGSPKREFLHVDDLARACIFLMESFSEPGPINVGSGREITIRELAQMVSTAVGYEGTLVWNDAMPNGTMRKVMDVARVNAMGWRPRIELAEGIRRVVAHVRHARATGVPLRGWP